MRAFSRPQRDMLRRLHSGPENVPGGQRGSGRDASAWTRTARSLQRLGAVKLTYNGAGTGRCTITDAGRQMLKDSAS